LRADPDEGGDDGSLFPAVVFLFVTAERPMRVAPRSVAPVAVIA